MTLSQITKAVNAVKPVSRPQLFRYIKAAGIEPLGARQRPQQYPPDSADRILDHLGLAVAAGVEEHMPHGRTARLPSMRELKSERSRAQKGRRK